MKETKPSQHPSEAQPKRDVLGNRKDTLSADVAAFASHLLQKYHHRFRRRPVATKKRILKLLAVLLPPYPRPGGRKRSKNITTACRMFDLQQREIRSGRHRRTDWVGIALECCLAYKSARSQLRRSQLLRSLESAVYARRKRTSRRRVRRTNKSGRTISSPKKGSISEPGADASNSESKEN